MLPLKLLAPLFIVGLLAACRSTPKSYVNESVEGEISGGQILPTVQPTAGQLSDSDTLILAFLGQTFPQASAVSGASIEIPPYFQIAASEITPLRLPGSEQFTGASARGSVYIRVDYLMPLIGFCENAVVTEQQVRMARYPVVLRGNTLVKATAMETVFTIRGADLEVEGPHELIPIQNPSAVSAAGP